MITSLNLSLIPSKELFTFSKAAIAVVTEKKTNLAAVVPFLNNAETKANAFQQALERESKNPYIKVQSDKDKIRVDAFMTFRNYCESATTRRKPGMSEAAIVLVGIIRKHNWAIKRSGLKARTADISNIVSEINTKYAAELATIGGAELLHELIDAQTDFELAVQLVVKSDAESNEPTVADTRPELTAALKAMFQYIGLQEIAAPSADVTALIASLNELITTTLSTVKASDTRAENKKKETPAEN